MLNIATFASLIQEIPVLAELFYALRQPRTQAATATLPRAARPFLLAGLHLHLGVPMLVLVPRAEDARKLYDQLQAWGVGDLLLFPEPDAFPYQRLASDPGTPRERLAVLAALADRARTPLVVACAHAVAQKTMSPEEMSAARRAFHPGQRLALDSELTQWMHMGYQPEPTVEVPGTFSRRGGILDVYPTTADQPVRIELLGNTIESLRTFDPTTQRSAQPLSKVQLLPAREILLPSELPDAFQVLRNLGASLCTEEAKTMMVHELERLLSGHPIESTEFYHGLFNRASLLDHLSKDGLLVLEQPEAVEAAFHELDQRTEELREVHMARGELPAGFPPPCFTYQEIQPLLSARGSTLLLPAFGAPGTARDMGFAVPPSYAGNMADALRSIHAMLAEHQRVLIITQQAQRLAELLRDADIFATPRTSLDGLPEPGTPALVQGSLSEGFTLPSAKLTLLTDTELFGWAKQRHPIRHRPVQKERSLSDIAAGDYIVHIDHGVGRFAGMRTVANDGVGREYLVLEYAQGDKLYVPVEQSDRVSPYLAPGEGPPALSRLGTQEWARLKERVRSSTRQIAADLLALYAGRAVVQGHAFAPDTTWQQEMEVSFPYVETPDQSQAIAEVKADLEQPRPMDRLVCGDVGYGKTEVAMRAAFKVVQDGMQVAVLVPTTVLAQQHFETFSQRLKPFPVRVEMLSRFRSDPEQREVVQGLREGTVDICIGTHRLIQKDVAFKNLGLVVVDEEQRFGVAHKEHLKELRQAVDILSLSATPIPRTLHMALTGIRDMSTMETPPEERLPVKTYVAPYDERLVREAILRELDRGGQVFFVHNRVHNILRIAEDLRRLVPEATFCIGHGQMPEDELERVMLDFSQGNYDVLLCTTIIESGLDMPRVNTLIINHADKLGLGQLYQLRGRVGRGATRAYAYLLYDKAKPLSDAAQKRLETILAATELGAGFRIAMKDLEIRGAGNLLGAEQSGHISAVGFDLYTRLLHEAVEELKARQQGKPFTPRAEQDTSATIDLPLPAHLPEPYVEDLRLRLSLYQRIARFTGQQEVDALQEELRDRFGPLPEEARNLLYLVRLKLLAQQARVQSVAREGPVVVLRFRDDARMDRYTLAGLYGSGVECRDSQVRLRLGRDWRSVLEAALRQAIP